jgi:hypothetical protein
VEHTAELPLSHDGSLVDPCDKEELCDGEHTMVSCSAPNILQENENKSKLRPHIQNIISQLPSYSGEFDPKVYVNWEMEVDKEFRKFELSEK